jgi:hypothetical protein
VSSLKLRRQLISPVQSEERKSTSSIKQYTKPQAIYIKEQNDEDGVTKANQADLSDQTPRRKNQVAVSNMVKLN